MSKSLSPEVVKELEKRGVSLSEGEQKSVSELLPDSASELTLDQLDEAAGGKLTVGKALGIGAGALLITAATVAAADAAQANLRKGKGESAWDKSYLYKGYDGAAPKSVKDAVTSAKNKIGGLFSKK